MKRIRRWLRILCLAGCAAACAAPEVAAPPPTRTPDAAYASQPTPAILSSAAARIATEAPAPAAPALAAVSEPPPSVPEPAARCITVNAQFGLSLRSEPNTNAERLIVLDNGATFPYVEANPDDTWYRIDHPGGFGANTWVFAEYAPLGPCTN